MVYVLRLDDLARDHHAHTIAAAITGGSVPAWDVVRAAFDDDLAAAPATAADDDRPGQRIKLRALGLAA